MKTIQLSSDLVSIDSLESSQIKSMHDLMATCYADIPYSLFVYDLSWKDEVILILDQFQRVRGFSTIAWNPKDVGNDQYDILFSGDTIIDKDCWGSQSLVHGFCKRAGQWKAQSKKKLYWFLMSKGYRTFLYLPLFSKRFYPSPHSTEPELEEICSSTSLKLFGDSWDSSRGIIKFPRCQGRLSDDLASDLPRRSKNPYVDFFAQRNANFAQGDELACITELDVGNLKRYACSAFSEGIEISQELNVL